MADSLDIRTRILDEKNHGVELDKIAERIGVSLQTQDDHLISELITLLDQESSDEAYVAAKVLVAIKTPKAVPALVLALQRLLTKEESDKDRPLLTTNFQEALTELLSSGSLSVRTALQSYDFDTFSEGLIQLAHQDIREAKGALRTLESCPEWQDFIVEFRPKIVNIEKELEEKRWEEEEGKKEKTKEAKNLRAELREKRKKLTRVEQQLKRITKHLKSMKDESELSKLQKSVEEVARFTRTAVDFSKYQKDSFLEKFLAADIERTKTAVQKAEKLLSDFEVKLKEKREYLAKKESKTEKEQKK